MEPTRHIYSTGTPVSAQDLSVSRGLYEFLKSHTNCVWGGGVEIFDHKAGCCHPVHNNHREELVAKFVRGEKVKPFVLTQKSVAQHLAGVEKHYFTGSKSADEVLIYLDGDCHLPWQDDPDEAVALLRQVMKNLYVCESPRGRNGYALFYRRRHRHFLSTRNINAYLNLLEMALRKMFIYQNIKTTIEVKGHVQHVRGDSYYCGRLGKLPNFGGMTSAQLEALKNTSRISAATIQRCAENIDAMTGISDELVRAYYKDIKGGGYQPDLTQLRRARNLIVPVSSTVPKSIEAKGASCPTQATVVRSMTGRSVGVGGDSFERGFEACLEMTRRLKRIPSVEEVLTFIHDNRLFTGSWEDNAEKRASRIAYNLAYIGRTFDPKKIRDSFSLDLSEFRSWAEEQYPLGIGKATVEEVCVFITITKFCVLVDPNEDGSLPYGRFRSLWHGLYARKEVRRQFKWERWEDVRDRLKADDVIHVFGKIAPRQAQKWLIGPRFPSMSQCEGRFATDKRKPLSEEACRTPCEERRKGQEGDLTLCLRPEDGPISRGGEEKEGDLTLCLRQQVSRRRVGRGALRTLSYQKEDAELHRMEDMVNEMFGEDHGKFWEIE